MFLGSRLSGITGFFLNAVHASQGSQNENGKRGIKLTRATAEQLAASRKEKRQVTIKSSHPVMSALLKEQKGSPVLSNTAPEIMKCLWEKIHQLGRRL